MNAVDTNVLIYAHDPRDARKQSIATALIESLTDVALLWQVACEYLSASKKLLPFGYSCDQAWLDIRDLRLVWATELPSWDVMNRAKSVSERHGLSYWDSMIVAACLESGVTRLFSEDFAGQNVDGLEVVNPFA